MIVTNNKSVYNKIKLLRNHGLVDRDTVSLLGYNSRMDTLQAVVGNWMLPKAKNIAKKRIANAKYLDKELIKRNSRPKNVRHVLLRTEYIKKGCSFSHICLFKNRFSDR